MNRTKSITRGVWWTAATAAMLWAGNWGGHRLAQAGLLAHSSAPQPARVGEAAVPERPPLEPVRAETLTAAIQRLATLRRGSVDPGYDWETQREMERVLAGLSTGELAELFARLDAGDVPGRWLLKRVGALWAAKDPDAAMQAALGKSTLRTTYWAAVVFNVWSADHPLEALAWLDRTGVLPADLQERFRGEVVAGLIERDFSLAGAEYLKLTGKAAAEVMEGWGGSYVDNPEMRERLMTLAKSTGRPEDFASLNRGLVEDWPQEDVLGMVTYLRGLKSYLESGSVPAEASLKTDASAVAAAIDREYTGQALEWWMERHAGESTAPYALEQAVQKWARKSPEEAAEWLTEQPASPQREALSAAASTAFATKQKYEQAAQSVEAIADATTRQQAVERVDYLWSLKDPAAAAAWRAKVTNPAK